MTYPEFDEDGNQYPDDDIDLDAEVVLDSHGRRITNAMAEEMVREVLEATGRARVTNHDAPR